MITYDEKQNKLLNNISEFFMNYVSRRDLTPYFDINVSNDLANDYSLFDKNYKVQSKSEDFAGMTILPERVDGKIQILISNNYCTPDYILHELGHMYDFVLFSEKFYDGGFSKVKNNKYYQTLIYWSEFHVKQIDIPYTHLLLDLFNKTPEDKILNDFISQIKTFNYPEYCKKFYNKKEPQIRDYMWFFGELVVCNLYDNKNTYSIPSYIVNKYGVSLEVFYQEVSKYLSFEDFVNNIENFHHLFS